MPTTRAKKTVAVDVFGMEATGPSKLAARAAAAEQIRAAMAGDYTPQFLAYGGDTVLVWRDPWGYHYGFVRDGGVRSSLSSRWASWAEVVRDATRHLVSNHVDVWAVYAAADVPALVQNQEDRAEIARNCRWQRAAWYAKNFLGLADSGAVHQWACGNDSAEKFSAVREYTPTELQAMMGTTAWVFPDRAVPVKGVVTGVGVARDGRAELEVSPGGLRQRVTVRVSTPVSP